MFCSLDANEEKDIKIFRTIMMSLYSKNKIFEKIHEGSHESVYNYDANIKSYLKKLKRREN